MNLRRSRLHSVVDASSAQRGLSDLSLFFAASCFLILATARALLRLLPPLAAVAPATGAVAFAVALRLAEHALDGGLARRVAIAAAAAAAAAATTTSTTAAAARTAARAARGAAVGRVRDRLRVLGVVLGGELTLASCVQREKEGMGTMRAEERHARRVKPVRIKKRKLTCASASRACAAIPGRRRLRRSREPTAPSSWTAAPGPLAAPRAAEDVIDVEGLSREGSASESRWKAAAQRPLGG